MRTLITSLTICLMFLLGSLCDAFGFSSGIEDFPKLSEESESETRISCLSSNRGRLKTEVEEKARQSGYESAGEPGTAGQPAAAEFHGVDLGAAQMGRAVDAELTNDGRPDAAIARDRRIPAGKDAVLIDQDLRVSRIDAMRIGNGQDSDTARPEYRISADVVNMGKRGTVMLIVTGKDWSGREVGSVMLTDLLDAQELKTLSTTASLSLMKSREIESWGVFRAHKICNRA